MIITRFAKVYSLQHLKKMSGDEYVAKEKMSRALPFEMTEENLKALVGRIPKYEGEVYDAAGSQTPEYFNHKTTKVPVVWFVDDCGYRPSAESYSHWDGHILLDLDRESESSSKKIFATLSADMPEWAELLQYSGSGSIHVLCRTAVATEQKTESHFRNAYMAFKTLLRNRLNAAGIKPNKFDDSLCHITQGMALWNKHYVFNPFKGFNVFGTAEYTAAVDEVERKEMEKATAKIINENDERIHHTGSVALKFVYDTKNATQRHWQVNGNPYPKYGDRFPVVKALKTLGVSEDETCRLCGFGFGAEGLKEVRNYYSSADADIHDPYFVQNLKMLKEYLTCCGISFSLQPQITIDPTLRPLNKLEFDEVIRLKADEYLSGNFAQTDKFLRLLEETDKGTVYVYSAPSTGKTEMAKFLIRQRRARVCYACGRNTVLEGKFRASEIDVVRCYGRYAENADISDRRKSVICSLNWLVKNWGEVLDGDFDYIILDEIHLTDEKYRLETMLGVLKIIKGFRPRHMGKLVLMTGTPSIETHYLDSSRTCFVKIEKERRHTYGITPVVLPSYKAAVDAMVSDITAWCSDKHRKAFIVENDTRRNGVLADFLKCGGFNFVDFNRKRNRQEDVQYVIDHSSVPCGSDGIILTSYMGVGNEIKDGNEWRVFLMPSPVNCFTASDVEQFAKRIRDKSLEARIYCYGSSLHRDVIDGERVLADKNATSYKLYTQLQALRKAENKSYYETVKDIVDIRSDENLYLLYSYQHKLYESSVNAVLSLLQNEYGWEIRDTEYNLRPADADLRDSRKRVGEQEKALLKEAVTYMAWRYDLFEPNVPEVSETVKNYLEAVRCGRITSEKSARVEGDDIFTMRIVREDYIYTDYHRRIAGDLCDFGGAVLCGYLCVIDRKSPITNRDLERILNRRRLLMRFPDLSNDLFRRIEEHLRSARYPFSRNSLSGRNLRALVSAIADLLPDKPRELAKKVASAVTALGHKDGASGSLQLDLGSLPSSVSLVRELEELEYSKRERRGNQKRMARRRRPA